ncbi:MAG: response regulator transcription factor [Bacteroidales bacterium]|nr:response regulator transcription factor [Bacteroidales bacterium]
MARVRAVLQRSQTRSRAAEEGIVFQGLQLNQTSKTATIDGEPLNLTRTEFELLVIFLSHPNKVFSRQQLLRSAWPQDVIVSERTVDVNLTRLRKKLGPYASRLISRQGYGYLFEE